MEKSYIPAEQKLPELTAKAIILAVILAAVLAASNAYLGLKVGLVVSASIPAAVVAMGLFRLASRSNILENNIVQAGASASAAVATGVVFMIPALIIIQAWSHINYWQTVLICAIGGTLGVLFSIPLRRALLLHPELRFPEGKAIAEVLKVGETTASLKELIWGSIIGGVIQFCQQGLRVLADAYQLWFKAGPTVAGLGFGFDITMIGAGYIVGFNIGLSIILGTLVGWVIGVPVFAYVQGHVPTEHIDAFVFSMWSNKIRYAGIGAMLIAGIWSLILAAKPIVQSVKLSIQATRVSGKATASLRTEHDMPMHAVGIGVILLTLAALLYLFYETHVLALDFSTSLHITLFTAGLIYFLIVGFILCAICAYFSGLIGMSASPVSAINIAAIIIAALVLDTVMRFTHMNQHDQSVILHAATLAIITAAIVACAAAVTNNTIQDLKTGEILGATPWKLQLMLAIGTLVSTLVIPPVVELLFQTYGIANVLPRPGMNPANALGAPQASLIAAVTQGAFFHNLPYGLISVGVILTLTAIIVNLILMRLGKRISIVGFAIGVYLPTSITVPLFLGSCVAFCIERIHNKAQKQYGKKLDKTLHLKKQSVVLIACGFVAGGSIMGLLLSIPFAIKGNVEAFSLVGAGFAPVGFILSLIVTFLVCAWMYRAGVNLKKEGQLHTL